MVTSSRELDFQFVPDCRTGRRRTPWGLFPARGSRFRPRIAQFRDSQQVVCRAGNEGRRLRPRLPSESCFAQAADRFQPAEDFLDPFSFALADSIAFGAGGTAIEPWRLAPIDSSDMRTDSMLSQVGHELLDVVALVGSERLRTNAPASCPGEHRTGRTVFGLGRFGDQYVDAQPVAVFHEYMPAVAELRRLAVALSHEARVRIGRALVRGVRALLTLEVDHPGAVAAVPGRLTVLALEALERGPRVDERAVDGEVIRGQEIVPAGKADHFIEKTPCDVGDHQALAQSAEVRLVEACALQIHVEKPAKKNVVVELLAKLAVGPNRVQRYQQLPLEQPFGSNRRAPHTRIQRIEVRRNGAQGPVGQFLNSPQRMIRRHARLRREIMEHRGLRIELAAHRCEHISFGNGSMTIHFPVRSLGFASPC